MRSNNYGATRIKVRPLKGQSWTIDSNPSNILKSLKTHGFDQFRVGLLASLLLVALAGAQTRHAGFKIETLDLSGAGIDLKSDMGVNGLDFLSDGRMAVATWGGDKKKSPKRGKVYVLSGVLDGGPIKAKLLDEKMNDNGGLVVVNDIIYVSNKDGIYKIDPKGASTKATLLAPIPWPEENYHCYHSTPIYKDGHLHSIVHQPYYDKNTWRDQPERGGFLKVNIATGKKTYLAGGLREPNGGNLGPEGMFFVADNQGHWVTSSKLVQIDSGDYFGFANKKGPFYKPTMEQKPPVMWFEHKVNGTSPNQPILLTKGIYKNQMLMGDHYHCNLLRMWIEKVDGQWQGGCVQVFDSKAFSSTINRMVYSPDRSVIYAGGMGAVTAWPAACGGDRTIQKISLTGQEGNEFEILAIRSVANGFELEFTDPPSSSAMDKGSYSVKRWNHHPEWEYHGGRHKLGRDVSIQSVEKGRKENRVILVVSQDDLKHPDIGKGYIQSTVFKFESKGVKSADGKGLHTSTAWYTLNKIGPGEDADDTVALKKRQVKNDLHLFVNSHSLYLRGTGEVNAKIQTLDGRVLREINAVGPAVLSLDPMPTGVHFLTGTLDGVRFTKKVVAAN